MIKKMMTTLKKEKGMVDVGEMMGLKKAADTMGVDKDGKKGKAKEKGKAPSKPAAPLGEMDMAGGTSVTFSTPSPEELAAREKQREERRLKLEREDKKFKERRLKLER